MHNSEELDTTTVTSEDVTKFYISKLYERITPQCDESLVQRLICFLNAYKPQVVNLIHGDLWFSNIIVYKEGVKLIDMRGLIGDTLTVKGDRLYDYAKIYQSLIGLDHLLMGKELTPKSHQLKNQFEAKYIEEIDSIKMLALYTIICSLPSWDISHQTIIMERLINELQ
jgi:aminoglycoside phosphotransferase family enzyme